MFQQTAAAQKDARRRMMPTLCCFSKLAALFRLILISTAPNVHYPTLFFIYYLMTCLAVPQSMTKISQHYSRVWQRSHFIVDITVLMSADVV